MKKSLLFLIVIFILIVAAVVGGYFYLTNTKASDSTTNDESTGSLAEQTEKVVTTEEKTSTSTLDTIPKLRHLTTVPTAGHDFVTTSKGYVIWYVDSATGHVFQTATSTLSITPITNTTISKVQEAYIGKGGSNIIMRTFNESTGNIQTFLGSPKAKTSTTTATGEKDLVGVFTTEILSFLTLSPAKESFFGMTSNTTSGIGNLYSWTGKATNVFSHPLKKWIPQWVNGSTILMTSAPSAKTQNISYFLNPSTKSFTKVLGPKNGLVVSSSPTAAKLLFSENKNNSLVFGSYDVKTGTETIISTATIPDKCVWSKLSPTVAYCGFPKNSGSGVYPDDWYQGKIAFSDDLRLLNTSTNKADLISNLEDEAGVPIDATKLTLSIDEKYLLFTNKNDLTLWMLEL